LWDRPNACMFVESLPIAIVFSENVTKRTYDEKMVVLFYNIRGTKYIYSTFRKRHSFISSE